MFYEPAHIEDKYECLVQFPDVCNNCSGAVVMGDITRKTIEKNMACVLSKWSHAFNSIIEVNGLKEVQLEGRLYAWANNLENPTFEKLDRM